ncbi:hypothetical protein [Psychroserpens mesophilus]|uniref:hypothetical protein n=1 Tax=Psychroserpens mesophilus TaxID=325473 RepID=UPI00058C11AE|nr:hypothetical protein [Psychroserpens mesophilus]
MKKLSILFSLFVLLTAFTCENEALDSDLINQEIENNDNNNNNNNSSLIGSWVLVDMNADIIAESSFQGIEFSSQFSVEISDSDYVLVFEASDYTVSGDYELIVSSTFQNETTTYTDSYTNVEGLGTYSTSGNIMTVDGSFIEFDFDGMPMEVDQGEQSVEYSLSADGQTLTFNQDEVQTTNEGGAMSTTDISSTSVWQKLD